MATLKDMKTAEEREAYCNEEMDRAQAHAERGELDMALAIMNALCREVDQESAALIEAMEEGLYFSFDNLMQMLLYLHRNEPEENVTHIGIPVSRVYHYYGALLFEDKRLVEAIEVLERALAWNPMSFATLMEHAEAHKILQDMETFREETMEAFTLAMTPQELARCDRNLGYAFAEKEAWADALAMNLLSLRYDSEPPMARSEIAYIKQLADDPDLEPTDLATINEGYGIPILPNVEIMKLAKTYAVAAKEDGEEELAAFFESILAPWSFLWD